MDDEYVRTSIPTPIQSGYTVYVDKDSGEVYAFRESTGECSYGVGVDGDVFAVDYRYVFLNSSIIIEQNRSVLWIPVDPCAIPLEESPRRSISHNMNEAEALLCL